MMRFKYSLSLLAFLLILSSSIYAQTVKQLNGQFTITYINSTGNNSFEINGDFADPGFSANQVKAGDRIIDAGGNTFEILTAKASGAQVNTTTKAFDKKPPVMGQGMIYRPTRSGFPLITTNTPATILTSALNTGTISIDNAIPSYKAGSALPSSSGTVGDVVYNSGDLTLYRLTASGWVAVAKNEMPTDYSDPVTSAPPGKKGDIITSYWDNKPYVFDGSKWAAPTTVSALPASAKFGDVFFVTGEKKLYMMSDDGKWTVISSSSIPGGSESELPTVSKPGDMFFNTDKNILYVYDNTGKWLEVSINGSVPIGTVNPDPAVDGVKEGNLFYNTSDHKLYVFNGASWISLDNALNKGEIFVGNASNIAVSVPLSGDATISTIGKLTIKDLAITEEKLDKTNIPLSGFGRPMDHVSMGNGTTNFKIVNLANPSMASDAATKSYVDALMSNPSILALANNHFFVGNTLNKAIAVDKKAIPISGFDKALANVSMGTGIVGGNFKIINMSDPSDPQDAATRNYVDTRVIDPNNLTLPKGNMFVGNDVSTATATAKDAIPLSGFGVATTDVTIGGFKLMKLAEPSADDDAATKKYVDAKIINPANLSLTKGNLFVGDANGKAADVLKNTIPVSGFGDALADVSMGGFLLTNLGAPKLDADASTKKYVDDLFKIPTSLVLPKDNMFLGDVNGKALATPKKNIAISGFAIAADNIYMGNAAQRFNISELADPIFDQDAATKNYVDSRTSTPGSLDLPTNHLLVGDVNNKAVAVAKSDVPVSDFGAATADMVMGNGTTNFKITNLTDPIADQDAATKKYVDSKSSKTPVGPTAPANPNAGDTYYNTTDGRLYVYNGTTWIPVDNKLSDGHLFVGSSAGIAVSTPKNVVPLSGFGSAQSDVGLGNFKLINLAEPTSDQDAATKKYVDAKSSKTPTGPTLPGTGTEKPGDTYYNTGDNHLYVYNGTEWVVMDNKLAKGELYVGNIAGIAESTAKDKVLISGFGKAKADIELGDGTANFKIVNLADPTADQDAATKKYVDAGVNAATAAGKDNLGNHEATTNLKLSVFSISNKGGNNEGLSFDTKGNASFGQDVTVNGNLYTPSDRNLKSHIETLTTVLQKIDQIRGVSFEYKDQTKYATGVKIGVIAQELQKVYPEMVTKGKDGFLKVDYTQLTGMLIQAVKEQQKEIDGLKIRMDKQQEQINSILKKMQ